MKDNLQKLKMKYIIFITIFFTILYKGAEFYTRTLDYVPSYFMAWEKKKSIQNQIYFLRNFGKMYHVIKNIIKPPTKSIK